LIPHFWGSKNTLYYSERSLEYNSNQKNYGHTHGVLTKVPETMCLEIGLPSFEHEGTRRELGRCRLDVLDETCIMASRISVYIVHNDLIDAITILLSSRSLARAKPSRHAKASRVVESVIHVYLIEDASKYLPVESLHMALNEPSALARDTVPSTHIFDTPWFGAIQLRLHYC
jgi:hypothetical protein